MESDAAFSAFQVNKEGPAVISGVVRVCLNHISEGDVIVRTAYAGINFKDALATKSDSNVVRKFPRIIGSDASGWVVASKNSRFQVGDEVVVFGNGFGVDHDGGFSQYIRVPERWVMPLPDGLTLLEAAALGVSGYTAALMVHLIQDNHCFPDYGPVLVNGATGSVAGMAIEMLARLGYSVTAVTSKDDKFSYLKSLGADSILNLADLSNTRRPLEKSCWGIGLDALGGKHLDLMLRSMKPGGVVASYGNVSSSSVTTSLLPFILRGVRLVGVNVTFYMALSDILLRRLASELKPLRMLKSTQVISMSVLSEQLQSMLNGETTGRAIVDFSTC